MTSFTLKRENEPRSQIICDSKTSCKYYSYNNYCFCIEYTVDSPVLSIIAYNCETKNFYKRTLNETDLKQITQFFTLNDFSNIFEYVFTQKGGHYEITVVADNTGTNGDTSDTISMLIKGDICVKKFNISIKLFNSQNTFKEDFSRITAEFKSELQKALEEVPSDIPLSQPTTASDEDNISHLNVSVVPELIVSTSQESDSSVTHSSNSTPLLHAKIHEITNKYHSILLDEILRSVHDHKKETGIITHYLENRISGMISDDKSSKVKSSKDKSSKDKSKPILYVEFSDDESDDDSNNDSNNVDESNDSEKSESNNNSDSEVDDYSDSDMDDTEEEDDDESPKKKPNKKITRTRKNDKIEKNTKNKKTHKQDKKKCEEITTDTKFVNTKFVNTKSVNTKSAINKSTTKVANIKPANAKSIDTKSKSNKRMSVIDDNDDFDFNDNDITTCSDISSNEEDFDDDDISVKKPIKPTAKDIRTILVDSDGEDDGEDDGDDDNFKVTNNSVRNSSLCENDALEQMSEEEMLFKIKYEMSQNKSGGNNNAYLQFMSIAIRMYRQKYPYCMTTHDLAQMSSKLWEKYKEKYLS